MTQSLAEHKLALAKELLEDIEYSRLPVDALLLKASRLARLMEAEHITEWLRLEMYGFRDSPITERFMSAAGRYTDFAKKEGYYDPLPAIDAAIMAMQIEMAQLRVPDFHYAPSSVNPKEFVGNFGSGGSASNAATQVMFRLNTLTLNITKFKGIRSRAVAALQSFVAKTYYELEFSGLAESIFDKHKREIDAMLATNAGDAMTKIPAIYDRLMNGEPEAVSQALTSCRRMIKAFADSIYPAGDSTVIVDNEEYEIGSDKVLNRIKLYLEKCPSKTRRARLSRAVRDIYGRESAGTHGEVTADEARSLFLATYLTLGEILLATKEMPKGSKTEYSSRGLEGLADVRTDVIGDAGKSGEPMGN
jgi:hypothetical protein